MLPGLSFPYHPYFLLPNLLSHEHSILQQNNIPFFLQNFLPHTTLQTLPSPLGISNQLPSASLPQFTPVYMLSPQKQFQNQELSDNDNQTAKKKGIKKVSNRPTNYLTQKSYYLAQPLPQQKNSQRILRPRTKKNRNTKTNERPFHPKPYNQDAFLKAASKQKTMEQLAANEEMTHEKQKPSPSVTVKREHQEQGRLEGEGFRLGGGMTRTEHKQKKQL